MTSSRLVPRGVVSPSSAGAATGAASGTGVSAELVVVSSAELVVATSAELVVASSAELVVRHEARWFRLLVRSRFPSSRRGSGITGNIVFARQYQKKTMPSLTVGANCLYQGCYNK